MTAFDAALLLAGAVLIKIGLARKSRDVTKADQQAIDSHAATVLLDDGD